MGGVGSQGLAPIHLPQKVRNFNIPCVNVEDLPPPPPKATSTKLKFEKSYTNLPCQQYYNHMDLYYDGLYEFYLYIQDTELTMIVAACMTYYI